jgi:hypothetical protein
MTVGSSTQLQPTPESPQVPRRALVAAARVALVMLLVAGVAMAVLGALALARSDPMPVEGWLREAFGEVFGTLALAVGGAIGLPAAIGLWTMAGARHEDAVRALGRGSRLAASALGVGSVLMIVLAMLVRGGGLSIVDVGIVGLVALFAFGLGAAATVSPHRNRALVSVILLALVVLGSLRLLTTVVGIATV